MVLGEGGEEGVWKVRGKSVAGVGVLVLWSVGWRISYPDPSTTYLSICPRDIGWGAFQRSGFWFPFDHPALSHVFYSLGGLFWDG